VTRSAVLPLAEHPQARVLVIDDERANLDLMARVLRRAGYQQVTLTPDPLWALGRLSELAPDLILLDLHMPGVDGLEVLRRLRNLVEDDDLLPRLVITADSTDDTRRTALHLGANDFLTKPIDVLETSLRVSNLLRLRMMHVRLRDYNDRLEEQVRARTSQLEDSYRDVTRRLALVGEYRDDDTAAHTVRVGRLAARLAGAVGFAADQVTLIGEAAPLHDIGKIAIPDAVLLKPGALSDAEFAVVMTHAAVGAHILRGSRSPLLQLAEQIAYTHHERWDGGGYPRGLRAEQIPLAGRVVAVVDVYDALSSDRPYKRAWSPRQVEDQLRAQRGTHFDPKVLDVFLDQLAGEPASGSGAARPTGQDRLAGSATTNVVPTPGRLSTSR